MATKKVAKKAAAKKTAAKKTSSSKPCRILRINSNGSITPPYLTLNDNECVRLRSPEGFDADVTLIIKLTAGGGGPITIHS